MLIRIIIDVLIAVGAIFALAGTITMDVAEEDGQTYYYIHWIDVQKPSGKEAGDAIKGTLEKGLRRVWK